MNLLILSPVEFPEEFPWDKFDSMYIADTGSLDEFPSEDANRLTTYVVTAEAESVPETLLNQVEEVIEDEDPVNYVLSRGIPGDIAALVWDESDEAYERLERLGKSGVTVLDPSDTWVEVVINKDLTIEAVIDTITQRVTADVLRIVRAELESRPRRFRSTSPKV